jgi:hypothetical protein
VGALLVAGVATSSLAVALAALATTSCVMTDADGSTSSSSSSGTVAVDSGDSSPAVTAATQACLDEATAYATAAMRCGGDFNAEHQSFINDIAGGDCTKVSILDVNELETGCLPTFTTISCDDLMNARFDPTCANQIQHN